MGEWLQNEQFQYFIPLLVYVLLESLVKILTRWSKERSEKLRLELDAQKEDSRQETFRIAMREIAKRAAEREPLRVACANMQQVVTPPELAVPNTLRESLEAILVQMKRQSQFQQEILALASSLAAGPGTASNAYRSPPRPKQSARRPTAPRDHERLRRAAENCATVQALLDAVERSWSAVHHGQGQLFPEESSVTTPTGGKQ